MVLKRLKKKKKKLRTIAADWGDNDQWLHGNRHMTCIEKGKLDQEIKDVNLSSYGG